MATIGQALASPEAGWRRVDHKDPRFYYVGTFTEITNSSAQNSAYKRTLLAEDKITFKFYGTSIRLLGLVGTDKSSNVTVSIDGVVETCTYVAGSTIYKALVYEKQGLSQGIHTVTITNKVAAEMNLDAVDLDATGYLYQELTGDLMPSLVNADWGVEIHSHVGIRLTGSISTNIVNKPRNYPLEVPWKKQNNL